MLGLSIVNEIQITVLLMAASHFIKEWIGFVYVGGAVFMHRVTNTMCFIQCFQQLKCSTV